MTHIIINTRKRTIRPVRAVSVSVACTSFIFLFIMMSGVAEAVPYGNIYVTSANASQWSTNLSNNDSTVTGNIIVANGTLNLSNAIIRMSLTSNGSYYIKVESGGVLNLADNSKVTSTTTYRYYNWWYEVGSAGSLADSTIEYCGYYNGGSYGLNIAIDSMIIDNLTISKNHYGIFLNSADNTNITNTSISNSNSGIYLSDSHNNNLTNNSANSNANGIYLSSSDNNILTNNIGNANTNGIFLSSSSDTNILTSNTITGSISHAIEISSSSNNVLRFNKMNASIDYNLYVTGNYNQDIDTTNTVNGGRVYFNYSNNDVVITDNNIGHITIVDCINLWFDSSTIHNGDGIRIRGPSSNVSIKNSIIEKNTMYGINLESTSWNNITSTTIRENTKQGVYVVNSNNNLIEDSDILDNNNHGFHSDGTSKYNRIINNSFINNTYGIIVMGDGSNNITDNNVSENRNNGISLGYDWLDDNNNRQYDSTSTNNVLHNNIIMLNTGSGVIFDTQYNYLSDNIISDNTNYAFLIYNNLYNNYIFRNNTANGEEINYYYNENGIVIESKSLLAPQVSNVGKITLIDCYDITVKNNELSNNALGGGHGLFLWESNNIDLINNTISGNDYGIRLSSSSNNDITDLDTITPSAQYGAQFDTNSNNNNITNSNIKATNSYGVFILSSDIAKITNTIISSTNYKGVNLSSSDQSTLTNTNILSKEHGLFVQYSQYIDLTNITISSTSNDGVYLFESFSVDILESNITAFNRGVYSNKTNNTNIINNTIEGKSGIEMIYSHWGDFINNSIDASQKGIFLETSSNHNLTSNSITDYSNIGILLTEYSTNTTMIGNDFTRNGAEFDIRINDSNGALIANNESTAANYTYYLTNDTRLVTLDVVINKTKVGYEDISNFTLMWRVDVFSWDNKHIEGIWGTLTLRYGDYSDVGGILLWDGQLNFINTRLSNKSMDYWGPPNSGDNWLPIIEYKQNATGKINYASIAPLNATVINRWDQEQGIIKSYRNITKTIHGPGVTIIVDAGYTPNGKCYYCHMDKITYLKMKHWVLYAKEPIDLSNPYVPGRCIDCHDKNDSENVPHGTESGKDILIQQNPQLCYNGNGNQTCHNSSIVRSTLNQEWEFSQATHHELGDGKMSCYSCHDNHGTEYRFDLHRQYTNDQKDYSYNSADYALCFVCHLEEKLRASPTVGGYLGSFTNQTNFRDEYYKWEYLGFNISNAEVPSTPNPTNLHTDYNGPHYSYTCKYCHNPHGSGYPATTRAPLRWTYITNITPPGAEYEFGDYLNQIPLDQANWSNSTLNQGAGFGAGLTACSYHGGEKDLPKWFIYREFVDYESAGGPGCVECHDSSDPDAIRPILNVSALKLAMHTNLSWDFRNGGNLQGKNWAEWGVARGYDASNISTDNAICWACHNTNGTPPYAGFHPDRTLAPYTCPKCHGPVDSQPPHTLGFVKAIDNHGPTTKGEGSLGIQTSVSIQTDVGMNGSCGNCHAPSLLPNSAIGTLRVWKYSASSPNSPDNTIFTGRTTNGDVSHYGLSRSQGEGKIANPLVNTSDCLFCHTNAANGAIWGNAMNVSGNMYGADTTNVSECYTYCHILPDYLGIVNETNIPHFHNKSIYSGGGPNCVVCHDVNGAYHVQSLVNATSIAQGMHGNVTNNTIELVSGIDPRSKPCWACHVSDGHEPEGMGDRNGVADPTKLPWTCEDCHLRSSEWVAATGDGESWLAISYPPNKLPPQIYTHHPNSSTVKTNVTGEGRCVDCHNNSIDPYYNDTVAMKLGNTIFSNVSHYGLSRSRGEDLGIANPLVNTSNCGICHNSSTNATIWGGATQNDHGNFDNYSADDGCYECHTTDKQTPIDFHAATLGSGEGGIDCLNCHNDSGFSKHRRINGSILGEAIHKDVNNASDMELGLNRSCWACHFENGLNADDHSLLKDPAYLCYDCHNKIGGPFVNVSDAPEVYNHFKSGTSVQAYWEEPTNSESCMGCHNVSEMFYYYLPDENETPSYYTNFSITSHYGSNRSDLIDKYEISNSTYCQYCHKNHSTPFTLYYDWITHQNSDCWKCHGTGRLHTTNLTAVNTTGSCTSCHADYSPNPPNIEKWVVNVTAMNLGVHANVNSNMTQIAIDITSDPNNSMCWGCHVPGGAYPVEGHKGTFNNDAYLCYECHNSTAKAYPNVSSAPAVYNHFKNGDNISANDAADTISESCGYGCHNLSSMKVPGFEGGTNQSAYRVNLSQASHYAKNRTDIVLSDDLSDCTWCHRNSTNEFLDIFERNGAPNYTENIPHATQIESCILADCHRRGRIHDENLTIPTWEWDEQCKDCHYKLNDSAVQEYYVNETMFNEAVHWNVDCTLCHVYIEDQPASRHPIAEYYWKWCECCHVVQYDPINDTDRHNVTFYPWNYTIGGESVVNITDCTVCHNATIYNASVDNYETNKCRYCHEYGDKGNKTSQEWY